MDLTNCEEKPTFRFQGCYFWGDAQVLGYGRMKRMVQGKDTLNKKQIIPFRCWCHGPLFFSVDVCASSSSWCCIIVASSPSLVIICSFSSIFYTSSSFIRCSAKAGWASLEISMLSSGGIYMAITSVIPEEIWYTICLEHICWDIFSTVSFENLYSSCCNNAERFASLSVLDRNPLLVHGLIWVKHFQEGFFTVWGDMQCKCKHWFVF